MIETINKMNRISRQILQETGLEPDPATPTLIKVLPTPLRRIIGDLSDTEKVLLGLDLLPQKQNAAEGGAE